MSYSETIADRKRRQPFDMFVQCYNGDYEPPDFKFEDSYYLDGPLEKMEVPEVCIDNTIFTTI